MSILFRQCEICVKYVWRFDRASRRQNPNWVFNTGGFAAITIVPIRGADVGRESVPETFLRLFEETVDAAHASAG